MSAIDFTHDPSLVSWVEAANGHPSFPVQNLPLGIFTSATDDTRRAGVAIGDQVLDLPAVADLLDGPARALALAGRADTLNAIFAAGHPAMRDLRQQLVRLLTSASHESVISPALHPVAACRLHMPFAIGDYTDFYTGIRHAENVGRLLRPDNPLLPNYKYVPIGYHGRASSICLSEMPVRRPMGQLKLPDSNEPVFAATARLDYELEMGIWIGQGNELGDPVPIAEAGTRIGGLTLLNDWSARDIQTWEYQPLGPFLGKSFQSNISAWVVTTEALEPFRTAQPQRAPSDPAPLAYLTDPIDQNIGAFDVTMEVFLASKAMRDEGIAPVKFSSGSMTSMYWTAAQLVTHHTSNGCNLAPGDLLGTGTLSGEAEGSWGSLMEITRGGKVPFTLPTGELRTFLEDGDELIMTAFAEREGFARIGFGDCRAQVLPAKPIL